MLSRIGWLIWRRIFCQYHHRKTYLFWVPAHKLLYHRAWLLQDLVLFAFSMIHRASLKPVHFVQSSLPLNKRYKMRLNFLLTFRLTLRRCLNMFLLNVFAFFQKFSSVFCCFLFSLAHKVVKIRALSYDLRVLFHRVNYYVEKTNCAACVISILFHEKHIFGYGFGVKCWWLLLFIVDLDRSQFIKEKHSQDWSWNHFQSPLLSR